jgi:hypothetical protein
MFDRYTEIRPGMDVCDHAGEKIGTVHQVFTQSVPGTMAAGAAAPAPALPSPNSVFQVDTGLLGLGTHFYIPFSAVSDITNECIFVNTNKDELKSVGWDHRPDWVAS